MEKGFVEEHFLKEALKSAIPQVVESLKDELTRDFNWQMKQTAMEEVNRFVTEWIKAQVLPEIGEDLMNLKDELLKASKCLSEEIASAITKSISDSFSEKMESSYNRRELFKIILG